MKLKMSCYHFCNKIVFLKCNFLDERSSPQQAPNGLFFGDMELNDKQKDALKKGKNMATTGDSSKNSFAAVQGVNLRWTNAVIPYVIDCSLGKSNSI